MTPSKDRLVWLDMEMTGLDPAREVPIQLAVIITSSELEELAAIELTLWAPESALAAMEPIPREMHLANGLLEEVRRSNLSVAEGEKKVMELLTRWVPYREGILCGNSIHQDRRFLNKYFPVIDGYLHYRMVDVSSLKELVKRWYGPAAAYTKGQGKHTALADVRESIDELRHYRKMVMVPPPSAPGPR